MSQSPGHRLVVVSNRIPVTLKKKGGDWVAAASSGGLATAMDPILKQAGGIWVGWSGEEVAFDPAVRDRLIAEASNGNRYIPVNISTEAASAFYGGYPNQTLWPLFHYFPSLMTFRPASWKDYEEGNARFAATVEENLQPGDLVWVHDYHLMLMPAMLRGRDHSVKVGFFLHIPFPSSEVFSMLPHREKILQGLLGADLIAFHTHRYLHHFRSSLLRILGLESTINSVRYQGRTIRLEAMPIGIAPQDFTDLLERDPPTMKNAKELRSRYRDQYLVIAVDRLDYTKGIPERLQAFRSLLEENAELRGKITLIQVAVPSREGIESYQTLRSELHELIGEINGDFGTPQWTPIIYIHRNVTRPELAALYCSADIACVTPLRDGMNLVAKEYCACKPDGNGVLILSELAGAAAEMGEALLVNPYDREQIANALLGAMNMELGERQRRMQALRTRVLRNNVYTWAEGFMAALAETGQTVATPNSAPLDVEACIRNFRLAQKRLLILDYDGTLVEIINDPSKSTPPSSLIETLRQLAFSPQNQVAVVSGRRAPDLDLFFGAIPGLVLIAEHGALVRMDVPEPWESRSPGDSHPVWKNEVRSILEHYVNRAPGSFIEEKEFTLTWHFRGVEPQFGDWAAGELVAMLEGLLADTEARPVLGKKVVEVRPVWANKGDAVTWLLKTYSNPDLVIAVGDDTTDEDVFTRLDTDAITVHVGEGLSTARYNLPDPAAVRKMLARLL